MQINLFVATVGLIAAYALGYLTCLALVARLRKRHVRLCRYMQQNPGWHFPIDLCKATKLPRSWMAYKLPLLFEDGWIEARPTPPSNPGQLSRTQWRWGVVRRAELTPIIGELYGERT